jgi:hypothetical protein
MVAARQSGLPALLADEGTNRTAPRRWTPGPSGLVDAHPDQLLVVGRADGHDETAAAGQLAHEGRGTAGRWPRREMASNGAASATPVEPSPATTRTLA